MKMSKKKCHFYFYNRKEKNSIKASIFGPWMLFCILIKLCYIIQLNIIKLKTKNNSNTFSLKWGINIGSKTYYIDNNYC